jgi:hypothetical protein
MLERFGEDAEDTAHLISLLLKVMKPPLHTVAAMQQATAYGRPLRLPCHTAIMTPSDSATSDAASCRLGNLDSISTAMAQATTGMAELQRGVSGQDECRYKSVGRVRWPGLRQRCGWPCGKQDSA